MRILYYATAYHASHGGSTHARAFVDNATRNPGVSAIEVFPGSAPSSKGAPSSSVLRKLAKQNALLQPIFFWRRNQFHLHALRARISTFKPDVLHIRLDSNFLQIQKLRTWFPALIISTEVNASPFDESFNRILFKSFFRRLERRCLAIAHLNFFVSGELRQRIMSDDTKPARDFVVQNGVDTDLFRSDIRSADSGRKGVIVTYVGTLDVHKKIDQLIEGFRIAHLNFPELRLLLIGDGPASAEIRRLVTSLGLDEAVRFTGWVSHNEIPLQLSKADIAVHHHANPYMSAIKIFEYMAMGLPVIGPDIPSVKEVFSHGKDIMLTNGAPEDLADKLTRLIQDQMLRDKIRSNGHALVVENYTWRANVAFIVRKMGEKLIKAVSSS